MDVWSRAGIMMHLKLTNTSASCMRRDCGTACTLCITHALQRAMHTQIAACRSCNQNHTRAHTRESHTEQYKSNIKARASSPPLDIDEHGIRE